MVSIYSGGCGWGLHIHVDGQPGGCGKFFLICFCFGFKFVFLHTLHTILKIIKYTNNSQPLEVALIPRLSSL